METYVTVAFIVVFFIILSFIYCTITTGDPSILDGLIKMVNQ